MNNNKPTRKILIILIAIALFFTVFLQVIQPSTTYQALDHKLYSITGYFKYVLFQSPLDTINDSINGFLKLKDAYAENEVLKDSYENYEQIKAQLIEAQKENLRLQDQLDLTHTMTSVNYINANVINRDSTHLNNTLLVNKGSNEGVENYMAVITPLGLIGQVTSTSKTDSVVTLLSSQSENNKFAVKVQLSESESVEAILDSYDPETKEYQVILLDNTDQVKEGMKVVTSGLGEIIPSGLLVGEVTEVTQSNASLSIILQVKPHASFSDITSVMIVGKP